MAGQRTDAREEDRGAPRAARPAPGRIPRQPVRATARPAAAPHTAALRLPASRGRGTGSQARAARQAPASRSSLLLAAFLPVAGLAVDGPRPGWVFAAACAAAAAVLALACPPRAWWVPAAPPLYVAAVTLCQEALRQAAWPPGPGGGTATAALRCAVAAFPAMAAAETVVLVLGPARGLRRASAGGCAHRQARSRHGTRSGRV